jgi:hypothetical protein
MSRTSDDGIFNSLLQEFPTNKSLKKAFPGVEFIWHYRTNVGEVANLLRSLGQIYSVEHTGNIRDYFRNLRRKILRAQPQRVHPREHIVATQREQERQYELERLEQEWQDYIASVADFDEPDVYEQEYIDTDDTDDYIDTE